MKPGSLNLFMKALTRLRVVPASLAGGSCEKLVNDLPAQELDRK
jgi:hypothetical protein